jgi:integrase
MDERRNEMKLDRVETMETAGVVLPVEADEITISRWMPGLLPEMASRLGLDPASVRDLPHWLKFPVNATAGTVIQPAFDFLASMARKRGVAARETCNAYAYDLRSWFEYLALRQQPWDEVTQTILDDYVMEMACAELADDADDQYGQGNAVQSPVEDLGLSRATIKRRIATLLSFYKHALPELPPINALVARKAGRRPQDMVRPIPPEEIRTFLERLGPRPSVRNDATSSRLWCCCAISLLSGMRRMEVCSLDVDQIRAIRFSADEPNREHAITLRRTKGGHTRAVLLPTWLLIELMIFIRHERGLADHETTVGEPLFVNHSHARRSASSRLAPATLSFDFRNAMLAADMRRKNPAFRYGTGASPMLHTFHDLRHTCACMLYVSYAHIQNPWIEVQTRLGHKLLKTTTDTYLRFLDEFRDGPKDLRQTLVEGMLGQ